MRGAIQNLVQRHIFLRYVSLTIQAACLIRLRLHSLLFAPATNTYALLSTHCLFLGSGMFILCTDTAFASRRKTRQRQKHHVATLRAHGQSCHGADFVNHRDAAFNKAASHISRLSSVCATETLCDKVLFRFQPPYLRLRRTGSS